MHFDHSGHIPYLKEHYSLEWWLHEDDFFLQSLAQQSGKRWGFSLPEPAVAENTWQHGEIHNFAGMDFEILHTPGHTLGGCCLRLIVEDGPDLYLLEIRFSKAQSVGPIYHTQEGIWIYYSV